MTTATTTRLSPAAGTGPSRITVSGPNGQVDLAVPATTTMVSCSLSMAPLKSILSLS